jgi:hypothetical protein
VSDEFDGWIERELHAAFAGLDGALPEPAYRKAPRRGLRWRRVVPVVLGGKLATGVAITCMAAASSVATSTVLTGNPDPFTLVHRSAAPAASPDTTSRPAAPGDGSQESVGGAASTPASNGAHRGASSEDPGHIRGGPAVGAGQAGGRSSGGADASGRPAGGNAPATPLGQPGAPHGNGDGTNGAGTGGGRGRSADASSSGSPPSGMGNPAKRY